MRNWKTYRLGDFLYRKYDSVSIDSLAKYKRITIKTKGQGIDLRDEVEGIEIGTKNQFKVKHNQFLLSKIDAMNGAFGIVPENCDGGIITGNFWAYDLNEEIIERKYLELLCIKQEFTKFSLAASEGTTNRKYLRENKFLNLNINLPLLAEQKQIVSKIEAVKSKLERIKQLRAEQTKDINNLLFSKYTELIETAEWLPMKEVAPIHRRQVEINPDEKYFEIGVRSFGRGLFEKPAFQGSDLTWQQPYWMKEGDLLFSNIKAWEGAVGLIPKQYDGWVGSHRYVTCLPNLEIINPEFLYYYFKSQEGVEKLSLASPGTVDRNRTLNTKMLTQIKIPVPEISLQAEFVELLHKVAAIKKQHQETEKELNELLPSLLDKAFKGELFSSSEKVVVAATVSELEEKAFLKRKVLATYIINQSLADTQFGDVKFEKLLHLSDFFAIKRNFGQKYFQQAAGPYDNAFTNAYFIQIEKAKWFNRRKSGKRFVFSAGQNHNKSLSTYNLFTNEELERVNKLITYFKKCDYEQPEIISTLYAVWNNRIIKNEPVSDDLLKTDFLNWDAQKIKYKDRLDAALQWMRKENIIPDGWGTVIEKAQRKHK